MKTIFLHVFTILCLAASSLTAQTTYYGVGSGSGGAYNTHIGYYSGPNDNGYNQNTFIGHYSGNNTTTGYTNVFAGMESGLSNISGYYNVFLGGQSGKLNTSGFANVFVGQSSGFSNTTGANNVFSGYQSGYYNTTGAKNVFSGYQSGYSNATGSNNVFSGYQSGYYTNGHRNTFSGFNSGHSVWGLENVFLGSDCGSSELSGCVYEDFYWDSVAMDWVYVSWASTASSYQKDNVAIGDSANYYGAGENNVFIGSNADGYVMTNCDSLVWSGGQDYNLVSNTIAIGKNTLGGSYSIAIGSNAISGMRDSYYFNLNANSIAIGTNAKATQQNSISIGYGAKTINSSDYSVAIGSSATTTDDHTIALGGIDTNALSITIGNTFAHSSAVLDITATTKGVLLPRLTTAQRTAIASPVNGLMVYDSTLKAFYYHNGSIWKTFSGLASGTVAGNTPYWNGTTWVTNSSNIFNNGGNIGIGTTSPSASAILDLSSTTKGVLIPRMTTAQRTAIAAPTNGLMVYDNTLNAFYYYNGSAWTAMSTGGGGGGATTRIKDADNNTFVETELTANENKIRFNSDYE